MKKTTLLALTLATTLTVGNLLASDRPYLAREDFVSLDIVQSLDLSDKQRDKINTLMAKNATAYNDRRGYGYDRYRDYDRDYDRRGGYGHGYGRYDHPRGYGHGRYRDSDRGYGHRRGYGDGRGYGCYRDYDCYRNYDRKERGIGRTKDLQSFFKKDTFNKKAFVNHNMKRIKKNLEKRAEFIDKTLKVLTPKQSKAFYSKISSLE